MTGRGLGSGPEGTADTPFADLGSRLLDDGSLGECERLGEVLPRLDLLSLRAVNVHFALVHRLEPQPWSPSCPKSNTVVKAVPPH